MEAIKIQIEQRLAVKDDQEKHNYLSALGQWLVRKAQIIEQKHQAEFVEEVNDEFQDVPNGNDGNSCNDGEVQQGPNNEGGGSSS